MPKKRDPNLGTASCSSRSQNSRAVSNNVSRAESVSKYFTRSTRDETETQPVSAYANNLTKIKKIVINDDDDFKTPKPVKKLARIFSNPTETQAQSKSKKKIVKRGRPPKKDSMQKTIEDAFKKSDVHGEHLQMAIALSISAQEAQKAEADRTCNDDAVGQDDDDGECKPVLPSTQQVRENVKQTLEQYGFKSKRMNNGAMEFIVPKNTEVSKRKKKSRFHYIKPILFLRTDEERKEIINCKIAQILSLVPSTESKENVVNVTVFSEVLREYHNTTSRTFAKNNINESQLKNEIFYLDELALEQSECKCGSLLKKWEDIPGREISPVRHFKDVCNDTENIYVSPKKACEESACVSEKEQNENLPEKEVKAEFIAEKSSGIEHVSQNEIEEENENVVMNDDTFIEKGRETLTPSEIYDNVHSPTIPSSSMASFTCEINNRMNNDNLESTIISSSIACEINNSMNNDNFESTSIRTLQRKNVSLSPDLFESDEDTLEYNGNISNSPYNVKDNCSFIRNNDNSINVQTDSDKEMERFNKTDVQMKGKVDINPINKRLNFSIDEDEYLQPTKAYLGENNETNLNVSTKEKSINQNSIFNTKLSKTENNESEKSINQNSIFNTKLSNTENNESEKSINQNSIFNTILSKTVDNASENMFNRKSIDAHERKDLLEIPSKKRKTLENIFSASLLSNLHNSSSELSDDCGMIETDNGICHFESFCNDQVEIISSDDEVTEETAMKFETRSGDEIFNDDTMDGDNFNGRNVSSEDCKLPTQHFFNNEGNVVDKSTERIFLDVTRDCLENDGIEDSNNLNSAIFSPNDSLNFTNETNEQSENVDSNNIVRKNKPDDIYAKHSSNLKYSVDVPEHKTNDSLESKNNSLESQNTSEDTVYISDEELNYSCAFSKSIQKKWMSDDGSLNDSNDESSSKQLKTNETDNTHAYEDNKINNFEKPADLINCKVPEKNNEHESTDFNRTIENNEILEGIESRNILTECDPVSDFRVKEHISVHELSLTNEETKEGTTQESIYISDDESDQEKNNFIVGRLSKSPNKPNANHKTIRKKSRFQISDSESSDDEQFNGDESTTNHLGITTILKHIDFHLAAKGKLKSFTAENKHDESDNDVEILDFNSENKCNGGEEIDKDAEIVGEESENSSTKQNNNETALKDNENVNIISANSICEQTHFELHDNENLLNNLNNDFIPSDDDCNGFNLDMQDENMSNEFNSFKKDNKIEDSVPFNTNGCTIGNSGENGAIDKINLCSRSNSPMPISDKELESTTNNQRFNHAIEEIDCYTQSISKESQKGERNNTIELDSESSSSVENYKKFAGTITKSHCTTEELNHPFKEINLCSESNSPILNHSNVDRNGYINYDEDTVDHFPSAAHFIPIPNDEDFPNATENIVHPRLSELRCSEPKKRLNPRSFFEDTFAHLLDRTDVIATIDRNIDENGARSSGELLGNKRKSSLESISLQNIQSKRKKKSLDGNIQTVTEHSKNTQKNRTENSDCRLTEFIPQAIESRITSTPAEQVTPEAFDITPQKLTNGSFETPNGRVIMKTRNVTPIPDYNNMNTPSLHKELAKFGLKAMKRKLGVQMLKYIYDSTHPLISEGEEGKQVKRRRLDLGVEDRDGNAGTSSKEIRPSDDFGTSGINQHRQGGIECIGDTVNAGEPVETMIFEPKCSKRVLSCQVPLHIAWYNLLSANPDVHENILLYEPVQVEVLHSMLKEQGFKYNIKDLISFLDRKCITVRMKQN